MRIVLISNKWTGKFVAYSRMSLISESLISEVINIEKNRKNIGTFGNVAYIRMSLISESRISESPISEVYCRKKMDFDHRNRRFQSMRNFKEGENKTFEDMYSCGQLVLFSCVFSNALSFIYQDTYSKIMLSARHDYLVLSR